MLRVLRRLPFTRTFSVQALNQFSNLDKSTLEAKIQDPQLPLTDLVAALNLLAKQPEANMSEKCASACKRLADQFSSLQPDDIVAIFSFCQPKLINRRLWRSYCEKARNCRAFTHTQIATLLNALVYSPNFNHKKEVTVQLTEEERLIVHLCKVMSRDVTEPTATESLLVLKALAATDLLTHALAKELCVYVLPQMQSLGPNDSVLLLYGLSKSRHGDAEIVKQLYNQALTNVDQLDPQAITMALAAMFELGILEPDLLKRLLEVGLRQVASFNAWQIATAFHYLCLLGVFKDEFARQLVVEISGKHFTPRGITTLLHALCRIGDNPKEQVYHLRNLTKKKSDKFSVTEIATILNAFARLDVRDAPLYDSLCESLFKMRDQFAPADIGLILASLTKLRSLAHPLVPELCAAASRNMARFKPQDLAHMLVALAFLEDQQALRTQVYEETLAKIEQFDPRDAVMALEALSKLGAGEEKALIRGLCNRVMTARRFLSHDVASLFASLKKLNASSEPLIAYLCKTASVVRCTPREVALMLDACVKLGINDDAFVKALCDAGRIHASYFIGSDVSSVLNSLYKLGQENCALFERLCKHGATKASKFNAQDIATILNVLAKPRTPRSASSVALARDVCAIIPKKVRAFTEQGLVVSFAALPFLEVPVEAASGALRKEIMNKRSEFDAVGINSIFNALRKLDTFDAPLVEALCAEALKADFPVFTIVSSLTALSKWELGPRGSDLKQQLWDRANNPSTNFTSTERTAFEALKRDQKTIY